METFYPWRLIQHLLFPQACELCGGIALNRDFSQVCPGCLEELNPLREPVCITCGKPLPGGIYAPADTCVDCRNEPPEFDMARAWGPYQGNLRTLLRAYKYKGLRPLSGPLSSLLIRVFKQSFPGSCDCVIPVPLHKKRLAERGYDQALLLANRLSTETGIPVLQGITRTKETIPQYGLSSARRKRNLAGAFTLNKSFDTDSRRILVLDDVYTTGSTASAMCKCLKENAEIDFIGVLTVARTIRHGPVS